MPVHATKLNGRSGVLYSHIEPSYMHGYEKLSPYNKRPSPTMHTLLLFSDFVPIPLLSHLFLD